MTKHRKWLSICLVICLIGGLGGGIWYRNKKIEEREAFTDLYSEGSGWYE